MSEQTPPPPYSAFGPESGPVLFTSSHSGRFYPAAMLARSRLPPREIRRAEDALVDQLLQAASQSAPVLAANYARAYVDLNRDPTELDPDMFEPALPALAVKASERVTVGLGVLPRSIAPGRRIYARPLPSREAAERIAEVHAPWHGIVEARLTDAALACGFAVLVDMHSMPSVGGGSGPELVIGDLHGRSAAPALTGWLRDWFLRAGYRVALNAPYAGAYTLERHGRPGRGRHAVQVEIDRSLYLDCDRLAPGPGFERIAADLARLARQLTAVAPTLGLEPPAWAAAAE
ncbi:MAG: N-formylglutamate amidohydrolase [Sphingomonadaceae bacterium]|nr:N-formylglutamate amidohydrolase [Sphingomonadaceae bacterium]